MTDRLAAGPSATSADWQRKLAFLLFVLAIVSALASPLVLASDLPVASRRALVGVLLFGLPMFLLLSVVGLVGQPAFAFIKRRIAWEDGPPAAVGLARHRVGLLLVVTAVVVSWLEPLLSKHSAFLLEHRVLVGGLADALVPIGLVVLGGEFWDKFHALFVHDAAVVSDAGSSRTAAEAVAVDWRFWVGVGMIACTVIAWGLVPMASAAGWSTAQVASLTGGIVVGNKVLLIAAIAIMGKPGFNHLKAIVGSFFGRFAPARQVSRGRYRLGLCLFLVPMMMTWMAPYVTGLLAPDSVFGFLQELALEVLLLVGLFMLGGEFWDKLWALFRHRAKVQFGRPRAPA